MTSYNIRTNSEQIAVKNDLLRFYCSCHYITIICRSIRRPQATMFGMVTGLSQTTTAGVHGVSTTNTVFIALLNPTLNYKFSPHTRTSLHTAVVAIVFAAASKTTCASPVAASTFLGEWMYCCAIVRLYVVVQRKTWFDSWVCGVLCIPFCEWKWYKCCAFQCQKTHQCFWRESTSAYRPCPSQVPINHRHQDNPARIPVRNICAQTLAATRCMRSLHIYTGISGTRQRRATTSWGNLRSDCLVIISFLVWHKPLYSGQLTEVLFSILVVGKACNNLNTLTHSSAQETGARWPVFAATLSCAVHAKGFRLTSTSNFHASCLSISLASGTMISQPQDLAALCERCGWQPPKYVSTMKEVNGRTQVNWGGGLRESYLKKACLCCLALMKMACI